jgi:hypothetical protein
LPDLPAREIPVVDDVEIDLEKVTEQLRRINPNKAAGPDGMPCRVLKELADVVADPFCLILRESLDSGEIPSDWLTANITPLSKKPPKSDPRNYGPISIICALAKEGENILRDVILEHIIAHNLFSDCQFRGRSGRSTVLQLL